MLKTHYRRGVGGAGINCVDTQKAPTLHAWKTREFGFGEQCSGGSSPSACFAGTSPWGRLVRL
ncbi:MAG: hypothetical protein IKR76_09150, partial [Ruminococcus sp.]|nr:hypothetical protein [Ruminococcus sp.]